MELGNYVIEFFSDEWFRNTMFSTMFILIILFIGKALNKNYRKSILQFFAIILIISTLLEHSRNIINGYWSISENLPLHLCGISGLIACFILFIKKNNLLFEFLFYSGIIGGIQAILTPQINNFDGSNFEYIDYYFSHAAIIIVPIYMYKFLNYELSKYSWLKVLLPLNILLAFIMPLNFQINSNYMYLAYPPAVDNPLIIGDWPFYIIYWEFIILIFTYTSYVISTRKSL